MLKFQGSLLKLRRRGKTWCLLVKRIKVEACLAGTEIKVTPMLIPLDNELRLVGLNTILQELDELIGRVICSY